MNNMRRGFTLIELIFVIVIIGILAAVALPRFLEIGKSAHISKIEAFAGTLNRTVGPTMWEAIQRADANTSGSFKHTQTPIKLQAINEGDEVETIPTEFGVTSLDVTACLNADTNITGTASTIADAFIDSKLTLKLGCIDGSLTASPHFFITDGTNVTYK